MCATCVWLTVVRSAPGQGTGGVIYAVLSGTIDTVSSGIIDAVHTVSATPINETVHLTLYGVVHTEPMAQNKP